MFSIKFHLVNYICIIIKFILVLCLMTTVYIIFPGQYGHGCVTAIDVLNCHGDIHLVISSGVCGGVLWTSGKTIA